MGLKTFGVVPKTKLKRYYGINRKTLLFILKRDGVLF